MRALDVVTVVLRDTYKAMGAKTLLAVRAFEVQPDPALIWRLAMRALPLFGDYGVGHCRLLG